MKTKTVTQEALAAAVALREMAVRAQRDAKAAFDLSRAYTNEQKVRVVALKAAVLQERQAAAEARTAAKLAREQARAEREAAKVARAAAKAERQARAQARKDAAVAKAEAKLAKARERALKPVGVKKAKADRKPSAVTVIKPAAVAV